MLLAQVCGKARLAQSAERKVRKLVVVGSSVTVGVLSKSIWCQFVFLVIRVHIPPTFLVPVRARYSVSLTRPVLIDEELQVMRKFSTFDFCLCQVDFLQRLAVRREVQLEQNGHTVI